MPILGYGVYQVTKRRMRAVCAGRAEGRIPQPDTAQSYFNNEEEVGSRYEKRAASRGRFFLTSKVWVEYYGYEEARKSVEESPKLQTDYSDLMLPISRSMITGAYRALEDLYDEGKLRAIGVSNFIRSSGGSCLLYPNPADGQSDRDPCAEPAHRRPCLDGEISYRP